ncbi:MAG: PAS domain-containing protein [Bacteroidetes bacterium]|nr:PAS domain-containing protein [Bacteroidota bacterium]
MEKSLLKRRKSAYQISIFVFVAVLAVTLFFCNLRLKIIRAEETHEREETAYKVRDRIESTIKYCISASSNLATLIRNSGVPEDFDSIAYDIMHQGYAIDAIEVLDSGKITHVYPLEGNESVIGYDILKDPVTAREAHKAIEKGTLYFAGPFELKQGGQAIIGRLAIFDQNRFTGFVAILIRLQTLLDEFDLDEDDDTYIYQLAKVNVNSGKLEFFIPGSDLDLSREKTELNIEEADLKLIAQNRHPVGYQNIIWLFVLSFILSVFSAYLTLRLRMEPYRLQKLVNKQLAEILSEQQKSKFILEQRNSILENIGDAFFSLDDHLTITYWNRQAEKLLGYPRAEVLGRNMVEIFGEMITPGVMNDYKPGDQLEQALHFRQHIPRLNKWFEVGVYPFPSGSAVFFSDITETIEHLNSIEKQNEILNEIAWIQSHVVRDPLARIMGIVHLMEHGRGDLAADVKLRHELMKAAHELDDTLHTIVEKANQVEKEIENSTQD